MSHYYYDARYELEYTSPGVRTFPGRSSSGADLESKGLSRLCEDGHGGEISSLERLRVLDARSGLRTWLRAGRRGV